MFSSTSNNVVPQSDTVVMFSGGWDSLYCYTQALHTRQKPDLLFFDYGQPYLAQEIMATTAIAEKLGVKVQSARFPKIADNKGIFDNRNLKFLEFCASAGYRRIYFGTRNLLPWFDKYGDSNWWFGRQQAKRLGVEILMPATMMPKDWIIKACENSIPGVSSLVFSTEGLS